MARRSWWDRIQQLFRGAAEGEALREGEDVAKIARRDPDRARAVLAWEQRQLADELERTFLAYEARLEALARKLHTLDGTALSREVGLIRETQNELRRVLRRASIAERETRELQQELGEWRSLGVRQDLLEPRAVERLEMLRSELALRGVDVGSVMVAPAEDTEEDVPPVIAAAQMEPIELSKVPPAEDDLEEWSEILNTLEPPESVHDAETARQMRDWAGERRLLDREQGIRRDRLALLKM